MKPAPLIKEVARTGLFYDMDGRPVDITRGLISDLIAGTRDLMSHRFRVQGYTSHMTSDSKDILGHWAGFFRVGDSLYGVFNPRDKAAAEMVKPLDCSMVVEEGIEFDGVSIPLAMTRVDIVGQGAVIGTAGFQEFPAQMGRSLRAVCCFQRRGVKQMNRFMVALAMALGLQDSATPEDMEQAIVNKMGLETMTPEEQNAAMTAAFASSMNPEALADILREAAADPEEASEVAALRAQVQGLQDESVDATLESVDDEAERKAMKSRYCSLRAAIPGGSGHKMAFGALQREVELFNRAAAPATPSGGVPVKSGSLASMGLRPAARSKGPGAKMSREDQRKELSAALRDTAIKMGFKPKGATK